MHKWVGRDMSRAAAGIVGLWLCTGVVWADEAETLQRASDVALQSVAQDLGRKTLEGVKNIAVVPLRGDPDGYVTERVRDVVTRTAYALFTRSDATWNTLLKEIEWGVRREDVMNPETVQKFGKIEGVDAILYGIVWDQAVNLWSIRGHAKLSLVLADVETGQELWRSGPLEGEAFMHWSDAFTRFWRYPLFLIGLLVIVAVLAFVAAKFRRVFRPL
jgi:hypothetical protein